jgi:shikimate dehydrogenase
MRKFGLIGKSLAHSWSKDYFQEKFRREGLTDCFYENYSLKDLDGLRTMISGDHHLSGLNITLPYKIEILPLLDLIDPIAEEVRAVNCIRIFRKGGSFILKGHNTDTLAFEETLKGIPGINNNRALVLGTGGASLAVCYALKKSGVEHQIVSRNEKRGTITYSEINGQVMSEYKLIINTTPAGMSPEPGSYPPLPFEYLTKRHFLYDLIYNPEATSFLRRGLEKGARVKNGIEMLHLQAELSWQIWNEMDET